MIAWNSASSSANDVEHEARRAGVQRADLPARLDSVAVLEAHVEDRDIGIEGVDPTDRLLLSRGLADHPDVALGLEQVGARRGGRSRGRRGGTR